MIVEPHVHRHTHPAKDAALRTLSAIANWTKRGDSLLAIARKV
jgi:hypothetical protein